MIASNFDPSPCCWASTIVGTLSGHQTSQMVSPRLRLDTAPWFDMMWGGSFEIRLCRDMPRSSVHRFNYSAIMVSFCSTTWTFMTSRRTNLDLLIRPWSLSTPTVQKYDNWTISCLLPASLSEQQAWVCQSLVVRRASIFRYFRHWPILVSIPIPDKLWVVNLVAMTSGNFLKIKIRVFDSIARHSARDIQSGQSKVYLNFEESEEECHVCSARHSAKKHN